MHEHAPLNGRQKDQWVSLEPIESPMLEQTGPSYGACKSLSLRFKLLCYPALDLA